MEYIVALFRNQTQADQATVALRHLGLSDDEYDVKTHAEYTGTVRGWLERLFGMPEPFLGWKPKASRTTTPAVMKTRSNAVKP